MKIHALSSTNATNFMTPGGKRARFVELLNFQGIRNVSEIFIFPKKN